MLSLLNDKKYKHFFERPIQLEGWEKPDSDKEGVHLDWLDSVGMPKSENLQYLNTVDYKSFEKIELKAKNP